MSETPLLSPAQLSKKLELPAHLGQQVASHRAAVNAVLQGQSSKLLVIVGPCSLHETQASLDYAQRLAALQQEVDQELILVMRAYLEKPRTCLGWKGMVNDPLRDGSNQLGLGLEISRQLLLDLLATGLPLATEALNPLLAPYFADLISWYALGARTSESQTHREMASYLPAAVGLKNATDGSLDVAINAIKALEQPQAITRLNDQGQLVLQQIQGNQLGHLVLRGGKDGPNYQPEAVKTACQSLRQAGVNPSIIIDASHANCGKQAARQQKVLHSVGQQLAHNSALVGVMLESFIAADNQPLTAEKGVYGQSMTDPCLSWDATRSSLLKLAEQVHQARHKNLAAIA